MVSVAPQHRSIYKPPTARHNIHTTSTFSKAPCPTPDNSFVLKQQHADLSVNSIAQCSKQPEKRLHHAGQPRDSKAHRVTALLKVENWRTKQPLPTGISGVKEQSGYQSPAVHAKGDNPEANRGLDPRWSRLLTFENCDPGLVIRSAVHEHDYRNNMPDGTFVPDVQHTVNTRFGFVYRKCAGRLSSRRKPSITSPSLYTHVKVKASGTRMKRLAKNLCQSTTAETRIMVST